MDPELDPMAAGGLLERIVTWAGQEVGTGNGYICLIEPDTGEMVLRLGTGAYTGLVGLRMLKGEGLSGRVWETGDPLAIPDYSQWEGRVRQVATVVFALFDQTALERFGGALERELGGGHGP